MKLGVFATMVLTLVIGLPIATFAGLAPDDDNDGVPNVLDNCSQTPNAPPDDCDFDTDGYGNTCTSDHEPDGDTDIQDFLNGFYPAYMSMAASRYDGDCDGDTDIQDFLNHFYPRYMVMSPGNGPSGLSCAGTVPCS